MKCNSIIFIVKSEYDNLGTGYMSALLNKSGFAASTIDLGEGRIEILRILKGVQPLIVGFSVIYHYYIDEFIELVAFLRKEGITCHFTAGGHYATIRFEELFELIPGLDSVVRSEGEYTILELAECLSTGKEWKNAESIVYQKNGSLIVNPIRPLESDLDLLPYPDRSEIKEYALGKKFATLLAGRGCLYNCSFCNLREFYKPFNEASRRIRKPELLADEMEYLFREKECSVFLFQDDDFPVRHNKKDLWIGKFCDELDKRELSGKVMWKINCRPDEIDENIFARMKNTGLFLVFIGIEDGTDTGLARMNKRLNVAQSMRGIDILKKLGIGFDYGFMLFQPETGFKELHENLDFLNAICSKGYSPVAFLKMMPYYATHVEKELMSQGRIKGDRGYQDYDFLSENMTRYFEFISDCFIEWTRCGYGVTNISKWARNYISVSSKYFDLKTALPIISNDLAGIIARSNKFMIESMKELADIFESGNRETINSEDLKSYRKKIRIEQAKYRMQINNLMFTLITLADLQLHRLSSYSPQNLPSAL